MARIAKQKNTEEPPPFVGSIDYIPDDSEIDTVGTVESSLFERDERGLVKGIEYSFTVDGRVDWRKMLKPEHLYINWRNEKLAAAFKDKYGKEARFISSEDILDLSIEDKFLLINLSGIKYLAQLRGIHSYHPKVENVVFDHSYGCVVSCTVSCQIDFCGNFESAGQRTYYGGIGGASLANTFDFAQRYIETIAENRAFVRCVRNFLGINVVGADEIGPDASALPPKPAESRSAFTGGKDGEQTPVTGHNPIDALQQKCSKLNISFSQLKTNCSKRYKSLLSSDPEKWDSWLSIDQEDVYRILAKIKESESK